MVDLQVADIAAGGNSPMEAIVEKPKKEEVPSTLSVLGRYVSVLSLKNWNLLKITPPGAGDKIQLTDAIASLIEQEQVGAFYMTGKSHDCGSGLGYMQAFVEYTLRHDSEGSVLRKYIDLILSK